MAGNSSAATNHDPDDFMSLEAFYGVVWSFFALCTVFFVGRLWIRWVSFGKFLKEDYVMLFALAVQLATTIICQLRLRDTYMIIHVSQGATTPPPDFVEIMFKVNRGYMAVQILTSVGIWAVKINFLLFFYRIFCSIRVDRLYRWIWWAVFVLTLLCFGAFLGLMRFRCSATNDIDYMTTVCGNPAYIRLNWYQVQAGSGIDVFNDVLSETPSPTPTDPICRVAAKKTELIVFTALLVMIFPIAILWRVQIAWKKKIYLFSVFMLILFTVTITMIRSTVIYGKPASHYSDNSLLPWLWFWLQMELTVSFLVALLISFRSLFTQAKKKRFCGSPVAHQRGRWPTAGISLDGRDLTKKKNIYDSILDTCYELEGVEERGPAELEDTELMDNSSDLECNRTTSEQDGSLSNIRVIPR